MLQECDIPQNTDCVSEFNYKHRVRVFQVVLQECDIPQNTVNLIINTEDGEVETLEGIDAQHLVVTTGADGTPIAFESVDISSGNVYHTLLQQDSSNSETQTVLLAQPQTHNE